ncbi:MAG: hypothetical protein ACREFY_07210, partial [Acetobacteraceae bacterium]
MTKRMLIDATHAEETRVVVLDGNRLEDFDVETSTKRQIKGNIYLAKIVRVEPSLQAAFVEYGGNRHGFLSFDEIHPDYYQIPVADRQRLLAMEAAEARREQDEEDRAADHATRPHPQAAAEDDAAPEADASGTPAADTGGFEDSTAPAEPARLAEHAPPAEATPPAVPEAAGPSGETPPKAPPEAPMEIPAEAPAQPPAKGPGEAPPEAAADPQAEAPAVVPAEAALADVPAAPDDESTGLPQGEDAAPAPHAQPLAIRHARRGGRSRAETAEVEADPDAEDLDQIPEEAPPESLGGENDTSDEPRPRRAPSRLLRNYKIQEVIHRRQILLV